MRSILAAILVFGLVRCVLGEEIAATPSLGTVASTDAKITHLAQAVEHLEAAGLSDQAGQIREILARETKARNQEPMVLFNVLILEVPITKLEKLGFSFYTFLPNGKMASGIPVSPSLDVPHECVRADSAVSDNQGVVHAAAVATRDANGQPRVSPWQPTAASASTVAPPASAPLSSAAYFGVLEADDPRAKVLEALRTDKLAKVLASPRLMTLNHQLGSMHIGGETKVAVRQADGTYTAKIETHGTRLDFTPTVLPDQKIHANLRVRVSRLHPADNVTVDGETLPTVKNVQTFEAVTRTELHSGETVMLGGLRQRRAASDSTTAAGKDGVETEDFETIVLVKAEIIAPADAEKL